MQNRKLQVIQSPDEVSNALEKIGLTTEIVTYIGEAAKAARNEALPIDPVNAGGQLAYIYGVRAIRSTLLNQGWKPSREGNIEATVNHELGVQLWFQNVDKACQSSRIPRAISDKGSGSRDLIEAQGELFDKADQKKPLQYGSIPTVWVVCVSSDDESIQVEVSRPSRITDKQYEGFEERIFVLDKRYEPEASVHDDDFNEPEVTISRKQE